MIAFKCKVKRFSLYKNLSALYGRYFKPFVAPRSLPFCTKYFAEQISGTGCNILADILFFFTHQVE